ncbi:MAG TPA: LD-carboxypeptidase [Caulobacterales bacterium]|nr:LD-carboxypeptidase [Caulobacterales bacterium]
MSKIRIGVVAPGRAVDEDLAERVKAFAASRFGARAEIVFHPQCFLTHGHFAGPDAARAAAFLDVANDPSFDALWFARGGYGSCRIAARVLPKLGESARAKTYLGYSDAGTLLAALYKQGFKRLAHGPMPIDVVREGGEAALLRALAFLIEADASGVEPNLSEAPAAAFNMTILSNVVGTAYEPDLADHVLMLEEVAEYAYRIDRSLFHITSSPLVRRIQGLRLGRCSDIPSNDPDFGMSEEEIARHWCAEAGIAYLGRADIGHDVDNRIVPFGSWRGGA